MREEYIERTSTCSMWHRQTDLQDEEFQPSRAISHTTFLNNCGKGHGPKTTPCHNPVVWGKEGHAHCKIPVTVGKQRHAHCKIPMIGGKQRHAHCKIPVIGDKQGHACCKIPTIGDKQGNAPSKIPVTVGKQGHAPRKMLLPQQILICLNCTSSRS